MPSNIEQLHHKMRNYQIGAWSCLGVAIVGGAAMLASFFTPIFIREMTPAQMFGSALVGAGVSAAGSAGFRFCNRRFTKLYDELQDLRSRIRSAQSRTI